MKKYNVVVGIDVSKAKLDVQFSFSLQDKQLFHFVCSNNKRGIESILKQLQKHKVNKESILFCFENTGIYSMLLAAYLSEKHIDYWEVPAIEIKRSKGISRGKNDKADAKDIFYYAISHIHKLKLSNIAERTILKLQLLFSEREKILKAINAMEATAEVQSFLPKDVLKEVLSINKATLIHLKLMLKKVDEAIMKLVNSDAKIHDTYTLICSVPGVGKQTAIYLIIKTRDFTKFDNWRKLACHAGIAPFEYQSGSSIKGKTTLSQLADKKMKSLLNMAALSAKKHDREIADYYERKVAEGKNKMLVLNAVRCKVISRVFAVMKRQTPFVDIKKFAA